MNLHKLQDEMPSVICRRFLTSDTTPGVTTLDVGCGFGELIEDLTLQGANAQGIEIDPSLIASCMSKGLTVQKGTAERIPFEKDSFERVVCSVVVPYTDERKAVAEWARVLKPGGRVYVTYHGIGYGIHYLCVGPKRFYGFRMLLNTAYYRVTGRKLPGFMGDTLCQSMSQLRAYYKECGLVLEQETITDTYMSQPRFICHQLTKPHPAVSG